MTRLRFSCLLFSLFLLFSLPAMGQEKVPPDRGYIQGGAYHSVRFGFSLKVPEGWEASTAAKHDIAGAAKVIGKDDASAKQLAEGHKALISLVSLSHPDKRQSIQVGAVDIYFTADSENVEEFLDATEKTIAGMTNIKVERIGQNSREINGRKVAARYLKTLYGDVHIYQSITAFVDQKFVVNFVGSFASQEAMEKNDVLASLTFDERAAPSAAAADAKPKQPRPQDGEVKDGVYTNAFFGLTVPVSAAWDIQDQEAIQRLKSAGERQSEDKPSAEEQEAAAQQIKYLLTAMPKTKGAVLMSFCQDLILAPDLTSAEQYLKLMGASMPGGQWGVEPHAVTLQGKAYSHGEYIQSVGEMKVTHAIYVTLEKKFAIVFDVISASPELRQQGQKIVEAAVFAPKAKAEAKP